MKLSARLKWISGWGLFPKAQANCYSPNGFELNDISAIDQSPWIPRGLGRSYGDSALAKTVISSQRLNRFIAFDPAVGVLNCQAGVSLAEILQVIVPQAWFLPVTPGTKFVSLGGAIASDVHGKNHHQVGCFSEFVDELELLTAQGTRVICSRQQNVDLFHASCGGMGLTGFILRAKIQLQKINSSNMLQQTIKTKNLQQTIEILCEQKTAHYSVAWLDCSAPLQTLGRSLIFLGEHANDQTLCYKKNSMKILPLNLASPLLNPLSIKMFNTVYYHMHQTMHSVISLEQYFYPLDRIAHWNRLYGSSGFTQYQFVLPLDQVDALQNILLLIRNFGSSSFLSVLKILGKENRNYLSFPIEGLTLAIDFKITPLLWAFLDRLDSHVIAAGGRVYLTKDCRLNAENFRAMYPRWQEFCRIKQQVDPAQKIQSLQYQRLMY